MHKDFKCPMCMSPLAVETGILNKDENIDITVIKLNCKKEKCGYTLTLCRQKELV